MSTKKESSRDWEKQQPSSFFFSLLHCSLRLSLTLPLSPPRIPSLLPLPLTFSLLRDSEYKGRPPSFAFRQP